MDQMTVVLDNRNIQVRLDGKSLRIDCPDRPMQRIPLGMVGQVIVYGNIPVDTNVWRVLAENGIGAVIFPARGSGGPAWLGPGISTAVMVRIRQFNAWSDPVLKQATAAWLVTGKLSGMVRLLDTLETRTECQTDSFQTLSGKTRQFLNDCLAQVTGDKSVDSLRGIEGIAAREWFGFMAGILPEKWQFSGRNRRPPRDPVNALLSLGYTLLVSEVRKAVHARGLDPCLGFLHSPYPGRESLVLDITEPLRPGVDAFVLALTSGVMDPEDFTASRSEGSRISKEGRGKFYAAWEEWKEQWPFSAVHQNTTDDPSLWSLNYTCTRCIVALTGIWPPDEEEGPDPSPDMEA